MNGDTPDIKAFLAYVDKGIVSGDFVKELDDTVQLVKSNKKAMKEFMTYQMALLEDRLEGHQYNSDISDIAPP